MKPQRPTMAPEVIVEAGVGEGELEDPERQQRHARRAVRLGQALQEEAVRADEAVAVFEHEGEAPCPERNAADAGVDDAFDEDVDGLALAGEARLEHDEADLHAEDEERGDQRPRRVDGVDGVHWINGVRRLCARNGRKSPGDDTDDGGEAEEFAGHQPGNVAAHYGVLRVSAQGAPRPNYVHGAAE